jgi:hypothetical protein
MEQGTEMGDEFVAQADWVTDEATVRSLVDELLGAGKWSAVERAAGSLKLLINEKPKTPANEDVWILFEPTRVYVVFRSATGAQETELLRVLEAAARKLGRSLDFEEL